MASTTTPIADAPPAGAGDHPSPAPGAAFADVEGEAAGDRVLVVGVAGRRWGIRLEQARQVLRARAVTRVPGAPLWVMGLLNVRGAVVPIGDLRARDGRVRVAAREGLVLLVEDGDRLAGLRVAEVVGVREGALAEDRARATSLDVPGEAAGLPSCGVARLMSDAAADESEGEGAEIPLLDVRALLDELLDGDAHS